MSNILNFIQQQKAQEAMRKALSPENARSEMPALLKSNSEWMKPIDANSMMAEKIKAKE